MGVGGLAAAAGSDHQRDDAAVGVGGDPLADGLGPTGPEQPGGGDAADGLAGGDLEDRGGALAGVGQWVAVAGLLEGRSLGVGQLDGVGAGRGSSLRKEPPPEYIRNKSASLIRRRGNRRSTG